MKFLIFPDAAGEWRWHFLSKNGRIMADSGEGYRTRAGARRAVNRFLELIYSTSVDGPPIEYQK